MAKKAKRIFQFKFFPGDSVITKVGDKTEEGTVDTCSISHNPEPRYWVLFPFRHGDWYMESLLTKAPRKD